MASTSTPATAITTGLRPASPAAPIGTGAGKASSGGSDTWAERGGTVEVVVVVTGAGGLVVVDQIGRAHV